MDRQDEILTELERINSKLSTIEHRVSYFDLTKQIKDGVESAMQNIVLWIIAIVAMGLMGDWVKSKFF